jgi:hypothetical protein
MAYQVSRHEPAIVVRGETITRTLSVASGTSTVVVDDGGSYTLYSATGVSQVTATTSSGAVSVAIPGALAVGATAYEVWDVAVASGTSLPPIRRQVLVTSADMLSAPCTHSEVVAAHNGLATYPTGQSSWQPQILSGWYRVIRWLMSHSALAATAELHSPDVLYDAATYAARREVFGYLATFGDEAALAWRDYYEGEFRVEIESLRARFDTDGDGIANTTPKRVSVDGPGFPPASILGAGI